MTREFLTELKERRSVREFTEEPVSEIDILSIIEAGCWAPSSSNHQPWKFVIIRDGSIRSILSESTIYSTIIAQCQVLIGVFLDSDLVKDAILDQQSVGAVMQNMLLDAEALGLGAVWIGEIRNNSQTVKSELGISNKYELAAMMAIGYPAHRNQKSHRKNIHDFILKNIGG